MEILVAGDLCGGGGGGPAQVLAEGGGGGGAEGLDKLGGGGGGAHTGLQILLDEFLKHQLSRNLKNMATCQGTNDLRSSELKYISFID